MALHTTHSVTWDSSKHMALHKVSKILDYVHRLAFSGQVNGDLNALQVERKFLGEKVFVDRTMVK